MIDLLQYLCYSVAVLMAMLIAFLIKVEGK
jgi:hypothetical protein